MKLTREEMIDLIKKVLRYKDGDYYVGSMATASCYAKLGLSYGHDNIEKELDTARIEQIEAVYKSLKPYIDHMLGNPTEICPCCGKERRISQFKTDPVYLRKFLTKHNMQTYRSKEDVESNR